MVSFLSVFGAVVERTPRTSYLVTLWLWVRIPPGAGFFFFSILSSASFIQVLRGGATPLIFL